MNFSDFSFRTLRHCRRARETCPCRRTAASIFAPPRRRARHTDGFRGGRRSPRALPVRETVEGLSAVRGGHTASKSRRRIGAGRSPVAVALSARPTNGRNVSSGGAPAKPAGNSKPTLFAKSVPRTSFSSPIRILGRRESTFGLWEGTTRLVRVSAPTFFNFFFLRQSAHNISR